MGCLTMEHGSQGLGDPRPGGMGEEPKTAPDTKSQRKKSHQSSFLLFSQFEFKKFSTGHKSVLYTIKTAKAPMN
jgi:hypothetical protein